MRNISWTKWEKFSHTIPIDIREEVIELPDQYMKIKVSPEEKERIKNYCSKKGLTVSAMLRYLILKTMEEDKDGK